MKYAHAMRLAIHYRLSDSEIASFEFGTPEAEEAVYLTAYS